MIVFKRLLMVIRLTRIIHPIYLIISIILLVLFYLPMLYEILFIDPDPSIAKGLVITVFTLCIFMSIKTTLRISWKDSPLVDRADFREQDAFISRFNLYDAKTKKSLLLNVVLTDRHFNKRLNISVDETLKNIERWSFDLVQLRTGDIYLKFTRPDKVKQLKVFNPWH